jgi:hypothetical protein
LFVQQYFFSQNKPGTSNQPAVLFSQNKPAPAISHQPNEQTASLICKQIKKPYIVDLLMVPYIVDLLMVGWVLSTRRLH